MNNQTNDHYVSDRIRRRRAERARKKRRTRFIIFVSAIFITTVIFATRSLLHYLQISDPSADASVETSSDTTSEASQTTASDISTVSENSSELEEGADSYITLTDDEVEILARAVYLEGGGESRACQEAIASVIINRMTVDDSDLVDVLYAEGQFEAVTSTSMSKVRPTSSTYQAVESVITYGPTIPEYVTYFRADKYHTWSPRLRPFLVIDNTYFSYDIELYNKYVLR